MLDNNRHLSSCPASAARRCLRECVLHASGKRQNSVCNWLQDGEGSPGDPGRELCGSSIQPNPDQTVFRELRSMLLYDVSSYRLDRLLLFLILFDNLANIQQTNYEINTIIALKEST